MTDFVVECEASKDENPIQEKPCDPCSLASLKPKKCFDDDWVHYNYRTKSIQDHARNWAVLCLTIITILLCLVFYVICRECLFAVLIFSACLCPFFHPMNAPLWLAILLLVVSGWTFTTGALTVSWSGQTF
jgi:uncharacterized membrane protein